MKKNIFTFLLLLSAINATANLTTSKITPKWEGTRTILLSEDSLPKLYFNGASYNADGLPTYHVSFPASSGKSMPNFSVRIKDAIFEECSEYEASLLYGKSLTDSIEIETFVSSFRHEKFLDISFVPLIYAHGGYHKLLSADLIIDERTPLQNMRNEEDLRARYKTESVLSSGQWVKISVSSTGVHKLRYEDIAAMGFSNPEDVAIYGYGGGILEEDFSKLENLARPEDDLPQVPVYIHDGGDGVFSPGDYLLFYAQGPIKEVFDEEEKRFYSVSNYYSNEGYYFVTCNGERKTMPTETEITEEARLQVENGLIHHYISSEETNLLKSGRRWYGYRFSSANGTREFSLPFTNISISNPVYIDVELMGYSQTSNQFTLQLENGTKYTLNPGRITNTNYEVGMGISESYTLSTITKNNPVLKITYTGTATSDYGYVMGIDANAVCALNLTGGSLPICYPYDRSRYALACYHITGADENTAIWDITNPLEISSIPISLSDNEVQFTVPHSQNRLFLAVNTAYDFPVPSIVGNVSNQNLHALPQCELVIVCPAEYNPAAETLAAMHREKDGMTVHIVTPEQVYNEFSSGTPDATAFRWFMKMFYDRALSANTALPEGILFIGSCSYDNRGIKNQKLLQISYQSEASLDEDVSYITDDYFGFLDDNEGNNIVSERMDIGVGRLPVLSLSEAQNAVNKIVSYANNKSYGKWRNMLTFVGDDGDNNIHSTSANLTAERMRSINKAFEANKIFFDAFPMEQTTSGASYPEAKSRILSDLASGTLAFTYFGHGSMNNLSHEMILTRNDVQNMNSPNPAFWLTAACDVGRFDTPGETSIGMDMILNPNGAAIGVLTTTRVVYSGENENLCLSVFDHLIPQENQEPSSIGMAIAQGKGDSRKTANKMKFVFFGDPVLTLHYPYYKVVTDKINDMPPSETQMQALEVIRLDGHIEDLDGNIINDFAGTVNITVYDKEEQLSTLDNRGTGAFTYNDFTSTLFRGEASVENGTFSSVFMIPKDINYSDGTGRIVCYAYNNEETADAHGYNEDFTVNGTAEYEETDKGPYMNIYMNHESFVSGQIVNPSPVFYAHLYDEYGINTSGAGIGHNLTLRLNNGASVDLNNYFTANVDDYTSGTVKYKFHDLENGEYELVFKAWNMQNISSEQSLRFIVNAKSKPDILNFYATPNPASDHVDIILEYDRPDNSCIVDFYIYDVTGIRYFHDSVNINTNGTYTTSWNLENSAGRAGTGLYIAKALITTEEGTEKSESIKFLIIKQ